MRYEFQVSVKFLAWAVDMIYYWMIIPLAWLFSTSEEIGRFGEFSVRQEKSWYWNWIL